MAVATYMEVILRSKGRAMNSISAIFTSMIARHLIRQARQRAGLTQAELAANAGTTQSAVARWESGGSTPSLETLQRIVESCGLELRYGLATSGGTEWALAQRNMALGYEQRLDQLVRTVAFTRDARAALAEARRNDG